MKKNQVKAVLKAVGWTLFILIFYATGGVISQIKQATETQTMFLTGGFIWASVVLGIFFIWRSKHSFQEMGFCKMELGTSRKTLFFLPVILLELSGLIPGFEKHTIAYILAALFITLAVGFAEEIYFRSLMIKSLESFGTKKAILISSLLFGIGHLANMIGGQNLMLTVIQIVFAFTIGIVFAELFVITKSLVPVILWHFLHDMIGFNQTTPDMQKIIGLAALQCVVLILYMIYLWTKVNSSSREDKEYLVTNEL